MENTSVWMQQFADRRTQRKDYFSKLSDQQQIDLVSLALNTVAATGSHNTVKDALEYLIDTIVELTS